MKQNNFKTGIKVIIYFAVAVGVTGFAVAAEISSENVYPLDTCMVSGEKIGSMGEPVIYNHEGREIRFCCNSCLKKFNKNPDSYLKKLDDAIIAQQLPYYTFDTCLVSGKKLDSMGEPANYVYKNRLIRFCCKGCINSFLKDPAKYLAKLDAEIIKQQLKSYSLETCMVSGQQLGSMGEPINYVFANRLVRFCCSGCIASFLKNPAKYMEKLEHGAHGAHGAHGKHGQHDH